MSKPVTIAISCYGKSQKIPDRYSVPIDYVKAVQRAGARVVLLPPGDPGVLDLVDGLVLAGGGDIDPARYGGASHPKLYGIDTERDEFECAIATRALEEKLPLLAICRGLQVVNCARGGTLHPHLEDVPGLGAHREAIGKSVGHEVVAAAGSRLRDVVGEERFPIRSSHHQAVDRPGTGLVVSARAEDGTIEALDVDGNPDALAVQWHPEESAADDPRQQKLFDWLVARAAARKG